MGKIEINFQNARTKARELNEVADSLERLANSSFPEDVRNVMNTWKGDNAGILCDKMSKLEEKLKKNAKKTRKTADSIDGIAQNLYNAEQRLQALINKIQGK